jgi:hypothetical protein
MTLDRLARSFAGTRALAQIEWRVPQTEAPPFGAHIVVERSGYTHHGIYIGAGNVVHYSGLSRGWAQGPVEQVPLREFSRGQTLSVRFYPNPQFDGGEIVERARSRLGENAYRVLTNNCEHFCEWCVLGAGRSRQVELLRHGPRRLLSIVVRAVRLRVGQWLSVDPRDGGWAV